MDRARNANGATVMDSNVTDCDNSARAWHTPPIGSGVKHTNDSSRTGTGENRAETSTIDGVTLADAATIDGSHLTDTASIDGATLADTAGIDGAVDRLESLELSSSADENGSLESSAGRDTILVPSADGTLPAGVDPGTVRVLEGPDGARVWLLGSVHFSERSQEDVSRLAAYCRPHVLALELCPARAGIMQLDEAALAEQVSGGLTAARAAQLLQGGLAGGLHALLLQLTARLTARLGVVPGGEFRRAHRDCVATPVWAGEPAHVYLADRPIQITLRRAMAALGVWQRVRLAYKLVTSDTSAISHADLERAKQRDILERMLAELSEDFPSVGRVFIDERDQFMSGALWHSCVCPLEGVGPGFAGRRVLAVVGIGHLDGIVAHWGRVGPHQHRRLLQVADPPRSVRLFSSSLRVAVYAGLLYAGCRLFTRDPVARGRDLAIWLARTLTSRAHTCYSALLSS